MTQATGFDVEQALAFLKNRIMAEAAEESVALSPAEITTLTYSEPTATPEERGLADKVDEEIGAAAYEEKITGLIRNAYRADLSRGTDGEWEKYLRALRDEDRYVLVMVTAAGVRGAPTWYQNRNWLRSFATVDILCLAIVGAAGVAVFFTRAGSFLRSDAIRAVAFVTWIVALWALGEWSKRRALQRRG